VNDEASQRDLIQKGSALLVLVPLSITLATAMQDKWEQAKREIRRLPPSAFAGLPAQVAKQLVIRGCSVPQSSLATSPHNVVRGEFAKKGQHDWAVLCSKNGKSTILLFWGSATNCPSSLALAEDENFLQELKDGRVGYSRRIEPIGKGLILKRYEHYGGPKPPIVDHQGIDDQFVWKASVTYYCYHGKWLRLTGFD